MHMPFQTICILEINVIILFYTPMKISFQLRRKKYWSVSIVSIGDVPYSMYTSYQTILLQHFGDMSLYLT